MIDERIEQTLSELENNLRNVESARKQVERTVNSYDSLNQTTNEYVIQLGIITSKIKELVDVVGKDYTHKVEEFEKDRENIVKVSNDAIDKFSNETEKFKEILCGIQTKLKYSLIFNIVSLVAMGIISYFILK